MTGTDLPGLPAAAVDAWLRARLPDLVGDQDWTAQVVSGGLSNITYRLTLAGGEVILRRPPLGGVLPSAHDMAREFRVISALADTAVPVPRALALDVDGKVLGYPFYVMTNVPGAVVRTAGDIAALPPDERAALADDLVATLAELHAVDPQDVGLGDYGRPDAYAERQIRRWSGQWAKSRTRDLPDMDRLLAGLQAAVPDRAESGIVHGDYRLDNTIVDLKGPAPRIAAVVDWELSTLGDPLADLGLALTYWEGGLNPDVAPVTAADGFPDGRQFAQQYAQRTGRDLTDLLFYLALGAMKLAVIMEGVHARFVAGHTVSGGYERAGEGVAPMVARGLRMLSGG